MFGGRGRYDSYDSYDYLRRDVNTENRLRNERNNERKLRKELEEKYRKIKYEFNNDKRLVRQTDKYSVREQKELEEKLDKLKKRKEEEEEKQIKIAEDLLKKKKEEEKNKEKQLQEDLKRLEKMKKEAKNKQEAEKLKKEIEKTKKKADARKQILKSDIEDLEKEKEKGEEAMKKHEEIRKKQQAKKQKWEELPEDRINQNIVEDEDALVEQIRNTFFQANAERPYYPFFMDPLQKGWSEKKKLWVEEMFNDKRLGENWFRNTPAQKVIESKIPNSSDRNDFWYNVYGTIYDLGIQYCDLLDKFPQNKYWNLFLQCYFQADEIRDKTIEENYIEGNRIIIFVDNCKLRVQQENIIDAYNMFFNDKYKFTCSCD